MCGIGSIYNLKCQPIENLLEKLNKINAIQKHRGKDSNNIFISETNNAGLCNTRLKIVDFQSGIQPMKIGNEVIVLNGEIYNYKELKSKIEGKMMIKTESDTEILLLLYKLHGLECLKMIKGIFSFVIYDTIEHTLFCAKDHFGIKPFYYTIKNDTLYISSEAKAIVEYTDRQIDLNGLSDYLSLQYILNDKTLFKDIKQLPSGCYMTVINGEIKITEYWAVKYEIDYDHTEKYFIEKLKYLLNESVKSQVSTDLKVGAYCSGGIDSSIISLLAQKNYGNIEGYHGRFLEGEQFDESCYAKELIPYGINLNFIDITANDFVENIEHIIYHMDFPEAGIGVFPQYMVAKAIPKDTRIMLSGNGGDEVAIGYMRYMLTYFEQVVKGSIDGTNQNNDKFIVNYSNILQNLSSLKGYEPMMQEFWSNNLFGERSSRYYDLINRIKSSSNLIDYGFIHDYSTFNEYQKIYNKIGKGSSYLNEMTFYDINTSLKALLHVEDRVSMANGIETRVPFLDNELFDFIATIPNNIKFGKGKLKRLLLHAYTDLLPPKILNRKNKMGFPVPIQKWLKNNMFVREFVSDILSSDKAKNRFYLQKGAIDNLLKFEDGNFNRNLWGVLCLEIWQQKFID